MRELSAEDCLACMRDGDFPESVRAAAPRVAVVLTQSWCPQWARMRAFLEDGPLPPDAEIFFVEYDKRDFFGDFMDFKETRLGNDRVPYVRYYREGRFGSASNYADRIEFLSRLGTSAAEG